VFAHAGRIKVPTTWVVGHDDPIADPARSQAVAAKVAGAKYHDLVGMRHEVFNEVERGRVFSELALALAAVS
jgi:alpha-beta hydrolase superfamily lysophospholipase